MAESSKLAIIGVIGILLIVIASFIVLMTVPLIPVKEEYGWQTFELGLYDTATTTFIVNEGWTLSLSYSASDNVVITFRVLAPDGESVIYEKSSSISGSFNFIANIGGSYKATMTRGWGGWGEPSTITVSVDAKQTGKKTLF